MALHRAFADKLPQSVDVHRATQLRSTLATHIVEGQDTEITVIDGKQKVDLVLTPAITEVLMDVLRVISSGKGFRLVPVGQELSTQEAADLLNVSRPHLVKLLESGAIPFQKVGRHRRVSAGDLFAYKDNRDKERKNILDDLMAEDADQI